MGIEPTSEAWEASILPLYDARSSDKASKRNPAPQGSAGCGVRAQQARLLFLQSTRGWRML
jgi:hypothetical protein